MSRNTEYTMSNKPRGLGSRSSKSSFPPSYFSSLNGISSSLSKVSLHESNINNSGTNVNLSAKKIKPRRSMLGRRSKMFSSNDTDPTNFLRPSHSSSSKKNIGNFLTTPQSDKNKVSPSHPFSDLNSSSFFENGQSSDFSTWSIFKKGDIKKPPRSPGNFKFQSAPVPVKETAKKNFELDNSLGTFPLDCSSPNVETEKLTFSAFKNKKLSVVKEETETVPLIISNSEVIQEEPNSLSELIKSWFIAKKKWDESRKQLEKDTQTMDELNNQINQILKSQITTTSNTDCYKIERASNKENESPTTIQDSASKNDLVDTIYGEFRSTYALLQTPSMLSSTKKKPINAQCYTPKSLSSCVKQQIKLIYGSDD